MGGAVVDVRRWLLVSNAVVALEMGAGGGMQNGLCMAPAGGGGGEEGSTTSLRYTMAHGAVLGAWRCHPPAGLSEEFVRR